MMKINARAFNRFLFSIALGVSFAAATRAQGANDQAQNRTATAMPKTIAVAARGESSETQTASVVRQTKFPEKNTNAAMSAKTSAPNPLETYRIGSGDVLDIRLVNAPSIRASTLYTVLAGGLLEFPLVGGQPLNVNNLTTDEIAALLNDGLKRRGVDFTPQFVVNVREFASHTILLNGLVETQGAHVLRREAVPLYVVVAEAIPKRNAGRVTLVSHATNERRAFDFADSVAMNTLVRAGDVLIVEERPREFFYITGEAIAAGEKDFRAGMTLTQAILAAGGALHGKANATSARIARQNADGRLSFVEYNLKEIAAGNASDPRLQSGDRIEVGKH